MATKKPQILLIMDEDLLEQVEDYRYSSRIPSRNEAIRQLIVKGLEVIKSKPKRKPKK